jgi:hypothetical protein
MAAFLRAPEVKWNNKHFHIIHIGANRQEIGVSTFHAAGKERKIGCRRLHIQT